VERYEVATTVDEVPFFCVYTQKYGERLLTVEVTDPSLSNRRLKKACEAMSQSPQVCSAKLEGNKIVCILHTFIYREVYSNNRLKSYELAFQPILQPIADVVNSCGHVLCRAFKPDPSRRPFVRSHTPKAASGIKVRTPRTLPREKLVFDPGMQVARMVIRTRTAFAIR
jgi:hypothetical protein